MPQKGNAAQRSGYETAKSIFLQNVAKFTVDFSKCNCA